MYQSDHGEYFAIHKSSFTFAFESEFECHIRQLASLIHIVRLETNITWDSRLMSEPVESQILNVRKWYNERKEGK